MALLTWSSGYSVGVTALDSQHTVLFDTLNDLHAAMIVGQAQTMTGPLLRRLAVYTREHFASEEAILAAAKYLQLAEHRVLHRNLASKLDNYATQHERGQAGLNVHLLNFLRDWLVNHIQKVDREYGPWLNEHGVR